MGLVVKDVSYDEKLRVMHLKCSVAHDSIVKTFFIKEAEFISEFVKGVYDNKWRFEVKFKYVKYKDKCFYLWLRHAYIYALLDVVGIHELCTAFNLKLFGVLEQNNVSLKDFMDRVTFYYNRVVNRRIQECFTIMVSEDDFDKHVLLNKGFEIGVRSLKDSEWDKVINSSYLHYRYANGVDTNNVLFSQFGFAIRVLPIAQSLLEASYIFRKYSKSDVFLELIEVSPGWNSGLILTRVSEVSRKGLECMRRYWTMLH